MANVNLGPTFEEYVQQKVATGQYASVSEVIREALRLLQQQDAEREAKIAWLREAVQRGLDSPVREWEGVDALVRLAQAREAAK